MADDLQALLDRINREGLQQAEQEKENILAEARKEAERIVAEARDRAIEIVGKARAEAQQLEVRGKEALRQAARDVLLSLRQRLEERLQHVIHASVAEAMTPELMGAIIGEIARAYANSGMKIEKVEVLLPADRLEQLRSGLLAALRKDLQANTQLHPLSSRGAGFQLVFNGADMVYDFTDEALSEALCEFLNPRLAELVAGDTDAPEGNGGE